MDFLNLNLDKTLSGNSNTTISSQKALKSYIDAKRIILDFLQDTTPTTYNTSDKWLNTSTKKLYIATSSSNWGNPIDLNIDQVYSFENLFYHYDGTDILNYSTESITEQNNNYEIKTWFGTQNEYDALDNYDANTLYNIVDNASILSSLLATQTEFNNSVSNKAATPYQVNQALGNYLPLAGGNLDAGAVLRLTNTNNQVVSLSYDTNNYLNISNNLLVNGSISANNLIATSGNIYNGSTSGAKAIWNNNYATSSTAGIVKPDNTTLTVDNTGTLTVIGGTGGGGSVILLQFLQSTTPTTYSANDKWLNISDYKLYTATSSSTWDNGQSITEDQIFGFNNLLYHYNGTNLIIYSTESVKNQNDGVEIKTWVGTQDEYNSISTYDNNTIYNIINSDTSITNQYHPPLFAPAWFDYQPNMMSWLRADTFSWQSGSVYTAAYNHLIADIDNISSSTETIAGTTITYYLASDGHKIVLADQETNVQSIYNATGVAWYYILDTNNTRFKLPRMLPLGDSAPIFTSAYPGTSVLTSGNSLYWYNKDGSSFPGTVGQAFALTINNNAIGNSTTGNATAAITAGSDLVPGNLIADLSKARSSNVSAYKYLYFYVGQFTQSATEQTAGLNAELFNGKADLNLSNINPSNTAKSYFTNLAMPSDVYDDLTPGASGTEYTAPADGYFKATYNTTASINWFVLSAGILTLFPTVPNANSAGGMTLVLPVKKGATCKYEYTGCTVTSVVFVYAEGSKWEKQ